MCCLCIADCILLPSAAESAPLLLLLLPPKTCCFCCADTLHHTPHRCHRCDCCWLSAQGCCSAAAQGLQHGAVPLQRSLLKCPLLCPERSTPPLPSPPLPPLPAERCKGVAAEPSLHPQTPQIWGLKYYNLLYLGTMQCSCHQSQQAASLAALTASGPHSWVVLRSSSEVSIDEGYLSEPTVVEFETTGEGRGSLNASELDSKSQQVRDALGGIM